MRVYVVQKDYIFYRIAVALRMECVDLSIGDIMEMVRRTPYGVRGFKLLKKQILHDILVVALRMECVDLSTSAYVSSDSSIAPEPITQAPYGMRKGFGFLRHNSTKGSRFCCPLCLFLQPFL